MCEAAKEAGIKKGDLILAVNGEQIHTASALKELIQKEDIEVQKIAALYFLDDMAIKDIAKLLGLKENTTKTKLYRLINKLKDLKMEE